MVFDAHHSLARQREQTFYALTHVVQDVSMMGARDMRTPDGVADHHVVVGDNAGQLAARRRP